MEVFEEHIAKINEPEHRDRMVAVLDRPDGNYPDMA